MFNSLDNADDKTNAMKKEINVIIKEQKWDNTLDAAIVANIEFGKPYGIQKYEQNELEHDYLRLVSWNVNMESLSAYCPNGWAQNNNKWDKIYEQVAQQNADIITLQEIPRPFYPHTCDNEIHPLIRKYIDSKQWYISNSTRSHCGHTLLLVNKNLENKYDIRFDACRWPAVILNKKMVAKNMNPKSRYDFSRSLILFAVHLMYGNHGSKDRVSAFNRLYQFAKNKYNMKNNFVLIGDTNMRDYDEQNILNQYKQKCVTSCWNLVDPEHLKLKNFMATFYRNFFEKGKQGTTRYDKIFCGKNVRCISLGIFDKAVSKEEFHFLSDHRGIVADIEIS
eukprot:UN01849